MTRLTESHPTFLAYARKQRGWTQEFVAQQVGVSVDSIRQWERGRHFPYQVHIQKLCELFRLTPAELGLLKEQTPPLSLEDKALLFGKQKDPPHHDEIEPPPHYLPAGSPPTYPTKFEREFSLSLSTTRNGQADEKTEEEEEKRAYWELYVEMITRLPLAAPNEDYGLLQEVIFSLYALSDAARTILRSHSPSLAHTPMRASGSLSFGTLVITLLNTTLRPFLSKWYPLLKNYSETRPASIGTLQHEQQWERRAELQQEIHHIRKTLIDYANTCAQIAEVSPLHGTIETSSNHKTKPGRKQ